MDQTNNNLQEWECFDPCVTCFYQAETKMPMFQIHLRVKRFSEYYWQTIMLPIMVMTLASWGTFCANVTLMNDRLTIILTLITITTAFKLISIGNLPKVNYQTMLDDYLLYNLLFQMAIVFEVCLTTRFSSIFQMDVDADSDFSFDNVDHFMKVDTLKKFDNWFLVISLSLWVLMHIWFAMKVFANFYRFIVEDRNLIEWKKLSSPKKSRLTRLRRQASRSTAKIKNRVGPSIPRRQSKVKWPQK